MCRYAETAKTGMRTNAYQGNQTRKGENIMTKQVVDSSKDLARGAYIGPDGKPECKNMRLIGHCGMEGRS